MIESLLNMNIESRKVRQAIKKDMSETPISVVLSLFCHRLLSWERIYDGKKRKILHLKSMIKNNHAFKMKYKSMIKNNLASR